VGKFTVAVETVELVENSSWSLQNFDQKKLPQHDRYNLEKTRN
jgi:hypothetical protein